LELVSQRENAKIADLSTDQTAGCAAVRRKDDAGPVWRPCSIMPLSDHYRIALRLSNGPGIDQVAPIDSGVVRDLLTVGTPYRLIHLYSRRIKQTSCIVFDGLVQIDNINF